MVPGISNLRSPRQNSSFFSHQIYSSLNLPHLNKWYHHRSSPSNQKLDVTLDFSPTPTPTFDPSGSLDSTTPKGHPLSNHFSPFSLPKLESGFLHHKPSPGQLQQSPEWCPFAHILQMAPQRVLYNV